MKKRQGFTLMELLLVIAILAIVAAVAAPQFFRSGAQAMTDARVALLKANYAAIKAAINMRIWDEKNNRDNISSNMYNGRNNSNVLTPNVSRTSFLIEKGYLQENAAYAETKTGEKVYLAVAYRDQTVKDPYDTVASSPIFMEQTRLYEVKLVDAGNNDVITGYTSIDDALAKGLSWNEIYKKYNGL